jgi:hypothetical protein
VCHKHRQIRRETFPAGVSSPRAGSGVCSFCRWRCGCSSRAPRRLLSIFHFIHFCGHRPRARCLNAIQAMPVQIRLTAPFSFRPLNRMACASLRSEDSKSLPARGSTGTPCHFFIPSNCGVAKWEGAGLISRHEWVRFPPPLPPLYKGSVASHRTLSPFWAARSFSRSPALQADERGAKPRRSTIS